MDILPSQKLRAFLCHAHCDKPFARSLNLLLHAFGVDPWLDEEQLKGGDDWELRIRTAVRTSHVVIVCLSPESINKAGFVQKEIRIALDVADEQPEGAIFLIPVKIKQCDIPERLRKLHCINFYEKKGWPELLDALTARANSLGIATPTDENLGEWSDLLGPETLVDTLASYGIEPKAIMIAEFLTLNLEQKFEISESRLETYLTAYPEDHHILHSYLDDLLETHEQYDQVIRIIDNKLRSVEAESREWASRLLHKRGLAKLRRWYKVTEERRNHADLRAAHGDLLLSLEYNPRICSSYLHLAMIYALQEDLKTADRYLLEALKASTDGSMTVKINGMRNLARESPEVFLLGMRRFYK